MRSAAKVCKVTVLVECNLSVFEFVDKFYFILVTLLCEIFKGISLGNMCALESLFTLRKFQHFLLDSREISISKLFSSKVDVIIKSVFNSRADTEFDSRIQCFEGLRHKVS